MASDPANVQVAVSGVVSVGPTGTTAPTDSTTALNVAFTDVGEIGDGGVVESYSDDTSDIRNNRGTVVRRVITGSATTLAFTMLETNAAALELFHKGSSVTGSGPYSMEVKEAQTDQRSFVLDVLDGTTHFRLYVPVGEVTERGDVTYLNSEAISYPVTITCYPDADGNVLYKFTDSDALA